MKRTLSILLVLLLGAVTTATMAISRSDLIAYASSLKGLKKEQLKTAIYKISQPVTVYNYGSGDYSTWYAFYILDRNADDNSMINRYSSQKFYFVTQGKAIDSTNIEHSFPKSWWGGAKNTAYKDLFNLYPTPSEGNSAKGNYPMGVVKNVTYSTSSKQNMPRREKVGTGTINGTDGIQCWEPDDAYKGDFSRAYMYMATTYQNLTWKGTQGLQELTNDTLNGQPWPSLREWAYTLYLEWCKKDSVSQLEIDRNNGIYNLDQKNRNLYVDFPNLAEYVWGDSTEVAFNPETSVTTADGDTRYIVATSSSGGSSTQTSTYKYNKVESITAGKRYLIVADYEGTLYVANPMSTSKDYQYIPTSTVTASNDTITLSSDIFAFTLEETSGGYYLIDSNNRYYYQSGSYTTFQASSTPVESGGVYTAALQSDGTFLLQATENYFVQIDTDHNTFEQSSQSGILPYLYEEVASPTTSISLAAKDKKRINDDSVYGIDGRYVGTASRLNQLPAGVYIVNGKKMIIH